MLGNHKREKSHSLKPNIRNIVEKIVALALGSALIFISCNNLYNSAWSWYDYLNEKKYWSFAQATIRTLESPENPRKWNEPHIEYDFEVKGKNYIGKRIDIFDHGYGRKGIYQFLSRYELGQHIMIYYDIRDPNRSALLQPAFSSGLLLVIPLANLFILLPIGLWLIKRSLAKATSTWNSSATLSPALHYGIDHDLKIIEHGAVTLEQALKIIGEKIADNNAITQSDGETVISKSMFGFSRSDDTFIEITIGDTSHFDIRVELGGDRFEKELHSVQLEQLTDITSKFFTQNPKSFKRFVSKAPNRPVER